MGSPENFVPFMPHGEATPASVQQTINGALELLGPNGENWLQGQLRGFQSNQAGGFTGTFCVIGALEAAAPDYESYVAARDAVKQTLGSGNVDRWNNRNDLARRASNTHTHGTRAVARRGNVARRETTRPT